MTARVLALAGICESFCPELIITDAHLPGTSGAQIAILAKQLYPSCEILLFSGQAATANLLEEAPQTDYDFEILLKPVRPGRVANSLL